MYDRLYFVFIINKLDYRVVKFELKIYLFYYRGHPLCEFCDDRFMDSEELFRHLRRNHLFCHFCDADGKHQFYNNMEDLIRHFREEHYLCEEGECKAMPLTAVFRTDIDCKGKYIQNYFFFSTFSLKVVFIY